MKRELNQPTVSFEDYRHYWRGTPKIGKTTMWRDMVMKLYNNPYAGMLLSLGNESGYKALKIFRYGGLKHGKNL
jgi:hypothetical protein